MTGTGFSDRILDAGRYPGRYSRFVTIRARVVAPVRFRAVLQGTIPPARSASNVRNHAAHTRQAERAHRTRPDPERVRGESATIVQPGFPSKGQVGIRAATANAGRWPLPNPIGSGERKVNAMIGSMSNTPRKPTAPTGRNLNARQYWDSLERSFTKDFIEAAKKEHERRRRLQVE